MSEIHKASDEIKFNEQGLTERSYLAAVALNAYIADHPPANEPSTEE